MSASEASSFTTAQARIASAMQQDAGDDAVQRLMRWNADFAVDADIYALFLGHPLWTRAARSLAINMLDAAARDPALDGIFKDAGRYVAALWAIQLHLTDGLTLPRLKAICTASGLLSPGRARALLSYLRYLDYVAALPARTPGETTRYVPTATLLAAWQGHLGAALEAACIVEPAAKWVVDRLGQPVILASFARIHGEELLESARGIEQEQRFYDVFMHRHAGTQILWSLLAVDDAEFPSGKPIPLSIAGTARRFNVSRIHIRRLLNEAEREGFLRCSSDGTVALSETARPTIQFLYVTQMIKLLSAAAKTVIEHPDLIPAAVPTAGSISRSAHA